MVAGLRLFSVSALSIFMLLCLSGAVYTAAPKKPDDEVSIMGTWSSGSQQVLTGRNKGGVRAIAYPDVLQSNFEAIYRPAGCGNFV